VRALTLVASAAVVAGCTSLPPAQDPVFLKLTDLEARLMRIERVFDNESLIQLSSQVDQLAAETQSLRGELETLRFENENAAQRQTNVYSDLASRIETLEQSQAQTAEQARAAALASARAAEAANAAATAAAEPPPVPQPLGSDQDNYNAAFDLIQARRYQEAATAFQGFLDVFPGSPLADNAQYWLAETFYVQRQFAEALPNFQKVIDDYPQSMKLPDALLKVGYCNYELRQWDAARTALEQVSRQFPDTTAARLATQRLERMARESG
jgi:tol-pal system protein YbgF